MFFMKKKADKMGPVSINGPLSRLIGDEWGKLPRSGDHWAEYLAVMRPRTADGGVVDVRIFDKWVVEQNKVAVQDFSSLDTHPDLVLMEGWFDQKAKKGEIKAKISA